jgi:TetR/AcrR family transcriptional regulator
VASASPASAPRRSRSGTKAERTRSGILAAAETLFAERGFASTRLEDVAAAVGIRRASIVYHFRDKAELYDAVLDGVLGALRARLEPILRGPGALAWRAEAAVSAWVDFVGERPAVARLVLRELADAAPGREPPLVRHIRPFFDLVRGILANADDRLSARHVDPVQLASAVAGSTVFYVAAMPTVLSSQGFDPLEPARLEAHRREVVDVTRRLLSGGDV